MPSKLIAVQVFDKKTRLSISDARVSVAGYPQLNTKTNSDGIANIIYPKDDGTVTIYVDGNTVYKNYVYTLPDVLAVSI